MSTPTLLQLRTAAKQRADMVNSTFVSDAEWNSYINLSIAELYDLIIENYGQDYYMSSYDLSLVNGTEAYALPADFYKLAGVDLIISPTYKVPLKRFEFWKRNEQAYVGTYLTNNFYEYRLRGTDIIFQPIPNGSNNAKLWYIPLPIQLSADADTIRGFAGWEEYVILDAAIKARIKEETPVEELYRQKGDMVNRLKAMTDNRDAAFPDKVTDTEYYSNFNGRRWP